MGPGCCAQGRFRRDGEGVVEGEHRECPCPQVETF